jgi:hypothetical protein
MVQDLGSSPFWRSGVERVIVQRADQAFAAAGKSRLALIVIERDLPQAEALIAKLRGEPATRAVSIVIVARGDMDSNELGLLTAGGNAVLRLPPDQSWDKRVERLLRVPTRKQTRFPVALAFEARFGTERVAGKLANVSQTGMLIESDVALPIGTPLDFDFHLPGFESAVADIKGSGRVVRLAGHGRFGVEFTTIQGIGAELLRRYLLVP